MPSRLPLTAWLSGLTVGAVSAAALAFALGGLPPAIAAPQGASPATAAVAGATLTSETRAAEAFLAQRYAEAYGRFAALADAGHAPSAGLALMMVTHGATLFGGEWSATAGQLQRWSALAARHAAERSAAIPEHDRGE